jgi:uncharacterized protein
MKISHKNKIASLCILVFTLLLHPTFSEAQKVKSKPATAKAQQSALPKSLLWEISGNGLKEPSYLYGTFHLLNHSYLNTVPEVMERLTAARGVVVETEIDSSRMMQLSTKMVMHDNKLSALLSKEDYALVNQEVTKSFGFDLRMADQMKPMTVMLMLSMAEYQKVETLQQYKGEPLDSYFARHGKQEGKKINTLETMEQQFDLLYNHHSVEKQAEQLVQYIKYKDDAQQMTTRLTNMYLDKDLSGMWNMSEEYNKMTGQQDMAYMIDDRNKAWMTKLPAIMSERSTFVAVGALHLPGQNGLLELLQKAGYTVKPLQ